MRLNILTRLIAGYLIILLGSSLISGFVIFELRDFSVETNEILVQENRIQEYTRKLTDALLSQSRYEKKYSILKDPAIYNQYLQAQEDFRQQLAEVRTIPGGTGKGLISPDRPGSAGVYGSLIEEVLPAPRSKNRAAKKERERAREEREQTKEEAVNHLIGQLEQLRISAQQNNLARIRKLGEAQEDFSPLYYLYRRGGAGPDCSYIRVHHPRALPGRLPCWWKRPKRWPKGTTRET